ncbi:hypothetical protein [Spiroplasma endosymbiont of Tipula paludosa]|uniref:hypothetical protein n=1 Tax=Spiroplasma endosymbiont of Tipula paludosa TaxID=3066295 RepID=UPI0035C8FB5B
MLDKYKDKNEFYSLVGIKCYSYVPSLLLIFSVKSSRFLRLKNIWLSSKYSSINLRSFSILYLICWIILVSASK